MSAREFHHNAYNDAHLAAGDDQPITKAAASDADTLVDDIVEIAKIRKDARETSDQAIARLVTANPSLYLGYRAARGE